MRKLESKDITNPELLAAVNKLITVCEEIDCEISGDFAIWVRGGKDDKEVLEVGLLGIDSINPFGLPDQILLWHKSPGQLPRR